MTPSAKNYLERSKSIGSCLNMMTIASGTFEPLRFVPKGKTVVLGLISSKLPRMEDSESLAKRIDEASRYVPLDDLALSPQCGFASTSEGNLVTEEQQWAKLKLVVDPVRTVWS